MQRVIGQAQSEKIALTNQSQLFAFDILLTPFPA
jgi:hypothetical protein